jgi:hypothetical protein
MSIREKKIILKRKRREKKRFFIAFERALCIFYLNDYFVTK